MILGGINFGGKLGGWTIVNHSTEHLPQALASAVSALETGELSGFGVRYKAIWYLASQLVNGSNHMLVCKQTRSDKDATQKIVVVVLNIPATGAITGEGATIREVIEDADLVEGVKSDAKLLENFNKAKVKLTGVGYTPVMFVGDQLVKGTNYFIVTEALLSRPGSEPYAVMVKLNVFGDEADFVGVTPLH